jgi:AcrR family transcriptional regulator
MADSGKHTAPRRHFRGLSPEARSGQRRERLVEAGIEAFGSRGFHAVTVREICAQAQLTERYFYESFRSMEELFAAVYGRVNGELKQATLDALATAPRDPLALAEAALGVFFRYVRADPRRARILLIESISSGQDQYRLADATTRDYTELMRGFVAALFPESALRAVNAELLSAGLVGANIRIATYWVQEGCRIPVEEVLASALSLYRAMVQSFSPASDMDDQDVSTAPRNLANTTAAGTRRSNPGRNKGSPH